MLRGRLVSTTDARMIGVRPTRSVTGPTTSSATAIASVVTEIDRVVADAGIPKSAANSGRTAWGE